MTDETKEKNNEQEEREEAKTFFQLEAVTLRGIGSYFHEARLEIKPLTILCGQNGSGKSTWFKILKFLRQSSEDVLFPLFFLQDGLPPVNECPSLLNELVMRISENSSDHDDAKPFVKAALARYNPEQDFGPLGTIGLEVSALQDSRLGLWRKEMQNHRDNQSGHEQSTERQTISELQEFVSEGRIRKGSKFILRFSFTSGYYDGPNYDPDYISQIECYKDDVLIFKFVPNHLIFHHLFGEKFMNINMESTSEYEILPYGLENLRELIDIKGRYSWEPAFTEEQVETLRNKIMAFYANEQNDEHHLAIHFLLLFRAILRKTFEGVFVLSANRQSLDDTNNFWYGYKELKNFDKIVKSRYVGEFSEDTFKIERSYALTPMVQLGPFTKDQGHQILNCKMLNYIQKDEFSDEEKNLIKKYILGEEKVDIDSLLKNPRRFWCAENCHIIPKYHDGAIVYSTPIYLYYWLCYLGIATHYYFDKNGRGFNDFIKPPCGFHIYKNPFEFDPHGYVADGDVGAGPGNDRNRYSQGTLYWPTGVKPLSSGFHHVFPILAQTAVMWPNETFCVESPEIYLHPSAVLKMTEYFITQAKGGRRFILETHSDLVVRRTLRAILEEELSQQQVNIYFTRLEEIDSHPALHGLEEKMRQLGSILELIKVNDRGQIVNWPEGFLDADVIEARRLIDAMYGAAERNEEKSEEDEQPNE